MAYRIHATPLREHPAWAVLQRRLFSEIEQARRLFANRYTESDGRLRFRGRFEDRDGVDDFYEPFFNWPAFYALGGDDAVLPDAKRHWEGVTAQLTESGMLTEEYENGYDWFHQGESLLFFYGLCAADPQDAAFAARARRFAELYTNPAHGNYDPVHNIITAPHTGALGPLKGLGPEWQAYSADQIEMRPYGLPLHHVLGVEQWEDLEDPSHADLMGQSMQRLAAGDVPVNLAATSLVANRWLYDGDVASAEWIARYVDGWRQRAADGGGLIPDNVSPDGVVGGLHDGRTYGGHYGWAWPHGLHSVGIGALIGGINASLVTGEDAPLDMARTALDTVLDQAITAPLDDTPFSLRGAWAARLGRAAAEPMTLVPHRFGRHGWFDYGPMSLDLPTWLWWWSRREDDLQRLRRVVAGHPATESPVMPFRDKGEAGHEAPWLAFLAGTLPEYPEQALSMALGQVSRRVAVMDSAQLDPDADHLHFWQRVNPVVTEVLSQLITGTPQMLYNGGLPFAAVDYRDADRHRPGLPADVAALVRRLEADRIDIEVVNISSTRTRRVLVRPSRFGTERVRGVVSVAEVDGVYPGTSTGYATIPGRRVTETADVDVSEVLVEIPPAHRVELSLFVTPSSVTATHHRSADEVTA